LATLTSARDDLDKTISDRNNDIVRLSEEIKKANAQRKKDETEYVGEEAEIDHAHNCVVGAVDMLNAQKNAFEAAGEEESFLQTSEDDFLKAIRLAADMADKRGDASAKKKKVLSAILLADHPLALVQADAKARARAGQPDQEETEFASGEIIGVVETSRAISTTPSLMSMTQKQRPSKTTKTSSIRRRASFRRQKPTSPPPGQIAPTR